MGRVPNIAAAATLLASQAAKLAASDADVGVLSAEHVENVDPADLDVVLRQEMPELRDRMRLVVYLRPHADRFVSSFVERSKLGLISMSMAEFYERAVNQEMLDYGARMTRWQQIFGERLLVRPFVRDELADGDVVRDFLGIVGGGRPVTLDSAAIRRNESVSVEDLALLMHVQARIRPLVPHSPNTPSSISRALGSNFGMVLNGRPGRGRTPVRLDAGLCAKLVERYAPDAAEIDRRFFDRSPMSDALAAAPARAVEVPQSFAVEDHFDAEAIRLTDSWTEIVTRLFLADPKRFPQAIRDRVARPVAKARPAGRRPARQNPRTSP
jgi:hypothetical protein